jgi:hypothetical protein
MASADAVLKFLIITTAVAIAVPAGAVTYIGMYADEAHSQCSLYPAPFNPVTLWVWVQPGEDGMNCVEYEIVVPANVIDAATIVNPLAGYHIGDAIVPPGATVCFPACQTDWIWIHQVLCLVTDANPSIVALEPHDDYGIMRTETCVDFGTYQEMTKINDMFINQECCLSSEESSWGAIKAILR